jgi:hypothetical protein
MSKIAPLILFFVISIQSAIADSVPGNTSMSDGITQLGLLTVGSNDIYMPTPARPVMKTMIL